EFTVIRYHAQYSSMMSGISQEPAPAVSIFRCTLGFILIGMAWGFTTPFIRRAARSHHPVPRPYLVKSRMRSSWICSRTLGALFAALDFLKNPNYAIPLVINLTGSVWFFLLVGQADLSLTVPITSSLSFVFTVLGDWYVDRKIISRDSWIGMIFSLVGICLCVRSKNT
ncbi:hypothetical protein Golomagni_03365, partial [Golovinomyces magnicellulatus]